MLGALISIIGFIFWNKKRDGEKAEVKKSLYEFQLQQRNLSEKLKEKESQNSVILEDLNGSKDTINQLNIENAKLIEKLSSYDETSKKLDDVSNQLDFQKEENAKMSNEMAALKKSEENLKTLLEESKKNIEKLEKNNQNRNDENKTLLQKIKENEVEISKLETTLTEKKQNYAELMQRFDKLSAEYNEIVEKDIKLGNLITELKKSEENLRTNNANLKEIIEKLELQREKIVEQNGELVEKNKKLAVIKSKLETTITEEKRLTDEKLSLLNNAKEKFSEAFENLSNKILETRTKKLEEENANGLKNILAPLNIQLKEFKEKVEKIHNTDTMERGKLFNELENLKNLNKALSEEATNLTKALKGEKKIQGNWGEIRLKRIFEESGLQEGIEYDLQYSITDETGKRYIPDAIVHLPDNRDVIVDSKVSLVSYEKYYSTDDDNMRVKYLKEFLGAIKNHIKELSEKSYENLPEINTLDYVLMFIPIEAAYIITVENERDIFNIAMNKNIMITSPSTLLITLRTIHNIWQIEQQNRNAKEIAARGARLYEKFVTFVDVLGQLGKHLDNAEKSYENSMKLLQNGRGNLISQSQKLIKLGVNPKKKLDETYIADELDFDNEEKK